MADQIFEIKFHNLFGYKFGRIVDEAHNLYNGDEGWVTKDEVKDFMDKFLEALNKESLRRVNRQKYKRCVAMEKMCRDNYVFRKSLSDEDQWYWKRWHKRWQLLAEQFKDK